MATDAVSMMSHQQQQQDDLDSNTYLNYDEPTISPTTALFPPELSTPSQLFNTGLIDQRDSYSASSDNQSSQFLQPYLSRPPSLSPSSQSAQLFQSYHSPSSASPRSNFSISSADDMLFNNNSFSSNDLDMLLFQNDFTNQQGNNKPGQPFFLPQSDYNSANDASQLGLSQEETIDLLNLVNSTSGLEPRRYSVTSDSFSPQQINSIRPPTLPQQTMMQGQWSQYEKQPQGGATFDGHQSYGQQQNNNGFQFNPTIEIPQVSLRQQQPASKPSTAASTGRTIANAPRKAAKSESPTDQPTVGKHNKTERRYRQKVQAAQADLRDAVPALRVLYGTSTEEQLRTTDIRRPDGTVDGLGEINRPNASAKTTIFLGARLYIELLQGRVATLERKVQELQAFRTAVAGEENMRKWEEDFNLREAELRASQPVKSDLDSQDDDDDESEEEQPKRKKPRATKPKVNKKENDNLRAFAAFAISFSFLPSAFTMFGSSSQPDVLSSSYNYESATTGQVLQRFPLITAEHTSRLLSRALPAAVVPLPTTLVSWTVRFFVALILASLVRPLFRRWNKRPEYEVPAGQLSEILKDAAQTISRSPKQTEDDVAWLNFAGSVIGGVVNISSIARVHLILRLNRIANNAHSLALLALLQPELPFVRSSEALWFSAREAVLATAPTSLKSVLELPLSEAIKALQLLPPTSSPITAIAEQVTLVHLNDLFSRFFAQLVDASTHHGPAIPDSVKALLYNLESRDVGNTLRSSLFDGEIRGVISQVPKGTAAHALGLVLIGLWGLLTGPTPSAQAALASALAAEEVKGVGSSLVSVSALRELLYPGSSMTGAMAQPQLVTALPRNALAIDKLALVCIQYISLLASTSPLGDRATRLERLEASQRVQKAVSQIRLVLTQTTFAGLDDATAGEGVAEGEESKVFETARERLVGVLSVVGRRAAGRAFGRDEDSGLEGDVDEL